jgi:hypothetical protein
MVSLQEPTWKQLGPQQMGVLHRQLPRQADPSSKLSVISTGQQIIAPIAQHGAD